MSVYKGLVKISHFLRIMIIGNMMILTGNIHEVPVQRSPDQAKVGGK